MPLGHGSRGEIITSFENSPEEDRLLIHDERRKATTYLIPKRYVFSLLSFTACCLSKSYNMNLSIAIVSMVKGKNQTDLIKHAIDVNSKMQEFTFDWNAETVSFTLAAVYYGQMLSFFPGGRMAELYGGKKILMICMLVSAIATFLSPIAALISPLAFIGARFVVGIGTGPIVPVAFYMLPRWIPESERSFHASIILSGFGVGSFISVITSGALCGTTFLHGWPLVFYTGGICGLLWVMACVYAMYEIPDEDPGISEQEYSYIMSGLDLKVKEKIPRIPWKDMILSAPLWALAIGFFGQFWLLGFFSTVLSVYMGTVLNLEVVKNGVLSCLPHLLRAMTSCLSSRPVDIMLQKKIVTVGFVRKGATLLNSIVSSVALLGITLVGRNVTASTLLFILGAILGEYVTFGVCMACIDIAPCLAGTVGGLMNVIGVFPFFIIPSLVGWITNYENSIEKWSKVFYCSIAIVLISSLIFLIFGDLRPQPWGIAQEKKKKEDDYEEIAGDSEENSSAREEKEEKNLVY